jgi:dUTP pyrophosphatase
LLTILTKLSTVNDSILPKRANATDAGADLRSIADHTLYPGKCGLIDTGVSVKIPKGFAGFIFNRSGQGLKGIIVMNSVGVIDSDYRGNIKVALMNMSDKPYEIKAFDTKIAQIVILPIVLANFDPVVVLDEQEWLDTKRRTGGFGSTG